jgi:GNAT superfamily N-acetyltransferase
VKIDLLSGETVAARLSELGGLLTDAVQNGASVGFVLPLADGEVEAYWHKVGAEVSAGHKLLFAAFDEDGRLVGSAQLTLEPRANGRHRAEVQKVMVLAAHRGRGLGAAPRNSTNGWATRWPAASRISPPIPMAAWHRMPSTTSGWRNVKSRRRARR